MVKQILLFAVALILAVCSTSIAASGATACTVNYYYTSSQNPEGIPAATTGTLSGGQWKIKPAGPSRTAYTKNKNGRVMAYTFDGWYTNINCIGTKYQPGKETTAIVPASTSGRYVVSLYGRWVYSEDGRITATKNVTQPTTKGTSQTVTKSMSQTATKSTTSPTMKNTPQAATKEATTAPVVVSVMENRSREETLAEWRHLLIDTFFHLNGRKYSFAAPGKYWTDSRGAWSGRTGKNGNTQSCITLPTVSLKRTGIISPSGGNIWLRHNTSSKPNETVKKLKKTSPMLTISYPHKSLKYLASKGQVRFGDILCRSGHTFVYMGKDVNGNPLIYESGTHRDIGNGTGITWGHHSGGHANKLTGKINKQIKNSNGVGDKWKKGLISDGAFKGHRATGKNLNKPVHIICSINTFSVRTSCTNGTITPGNNYMAGRDVRISYAPIEGKTLDSIQIDGKTVNAAAYSAGHTFPKISGNHWISVVYK